MNTLRKTTIVRAAAVLLLFVMLIGALGVSGMRSARAATPIYVLAIGDSNTYGYVQALAKYALGDVDFDGDVDASDIDKYNEWKNNNTWPTSGNVFVRADTNFDNRVDATDLTNVERAVKGEYNRAGYGKAGPYKDRASFRLPLWQLFQTKANTTHTFTFVGTVDSTQDGKTYELDKPTACEGDNCLATYPPQSAQYPRPANNNRDLAFVGWFGAKAVDVANGAPNNGAPPANVPANLYGIVPALAAIAEKPHVALINLGTNDINKGRTDSVDKLKEIVTTLQGDNPSMTIYVAEIIPAGYSGDGVCQDYKGDNEGTFAADCAKFKHDPLTAPDVATPVRTYNSKLRTELCGLSESAALVGKYARMCTDLTTSTSTVYLVDLHTDFDRENWLVGSDEIHLNIQGECQVALRWYDAMDSTLGSHMPGLIMDAAPASFCSAYVETDPTPIDPCEPVDGNVVANFCFDDGVAPWGFFHSSGQGSYGLSGDSPFGGEYAAEITIDQRARNMQLFQKDLVLQPNTRYELSFAAYSSDGRDMKVWVHKHSKPYSSYGLMGRRVNLSTEWQLFVLEFTTPNRTDMTDARLRFWFRGPAQAGTIYHIDRVVLRPLP